MEAIIEIFGNIGFDPWEMGEAYTTFEDVQRQFESVENPTSIIVYINSPGGNLTEGYAMFDYLVSQGLPITTVGIGLVASIATVVFLSGNERRRFLRPNTRFLVHNPIPAIGIQTDAEGYEEIASALRREEDELIRFYNSQTGINEATIRQMMNEERFLTAREAVNIGFASAIQITQDSGSSEAKDEVALVAKYVSKTTLKIRELDNNLNQKQDMNFNLKEGLKNLLNQAESQPPNTDGQEESVEATETPVEESVDWEAKYNELKQEMDSMGSEIETQVTEVIAEVSTQFVNQISELKTLINKQSERIENLEKQPVSNTKLKAKITENAGPNPFDNLAASFKNKLMG